MYEATFRVADDRGYAAATRGTDLAIELWCDDHSDLLCVTGADAGRAVERVRDQVGVAEAAVEGDEHVVVTEDCLVRHTDRNVERYLAAHDCLLLPPLRYADGAKHCRVLALDPANLSALYRDLSGAFAVDVEEKREVTAPRPDELLRSPGSALPSLSPRQREVLRHAREAGYYEIPRGTTTREIAEHFGVDRRTAEEHLRRAENKLLTALVDDGLV